jgi:hypothetical protein
MSVDLPAAAPERDTSRDHPLRGEVLLHTLPKRTRNREILALSDLSGNPEPLAHAVTHAEYATIANDTVTATELGQNSEIVLVGDLLDRTPHFPKLVALIEKIRKAGISVTALYGNHDVAALAMISEPPDVSAGGFFPPGFSIGSHIKSNGVEQTLTSIEDDYVNSEGNIIRWSEEKNWLKRRSYEDEACGMKKSVDGIIALRRLVADSRTAYSKLFSSLQPTVMHDDILFLHAGLSNEWLSSAIEKGIPAANAEWKKSLEDPTMLHKMTFGTPDIRGDTCYGSTFPESANLIWSRCLAVLDEKSTFGMFGFLDDDKCKNLKKLGANSMVRGHDPTHTHRQLVLEHDGIAVVNIEVKLDENSRGYTRISRGGQVLAYPPMKEKTAPNEPKKA